MNIIDYLKWRGDLSFKASPFNEVDNLVIAYASYTLIEPYVKEGASYTVKELSDKYMADHSEEEIRNNPSFIAMAPLVLREMAESVRFKDALIHDVVSSINDDKTEQFCAMQVDLSDKTTYIAFRGTDDTLLGWHEDFDMSFKTIEAQKSALCYLKEHMRPGRKYRIGGHSKGGNLAIYAALNYPARHKNMINVYSNDGPALNTRFLPEDYRKNLQSLGRRYVKIIPEYDVFGGIFDFNEKKEVIVSDASTIMEHDAMSWQVEGNHFIRGTMSNETKIIAKAFKNFMSEIELDQCELFVQQLFNAFDEANVKTIGDFARGGLPVFILTLNKFSEMSKESKDLASKLLDIFVDEYKSSIIEGYINNIEERKEKIEERKEMIESEVKNALEKAGNDTMTFIKKVTKVDLQKIKKTHLNDKKED